MRLKDKVALVTGSSRGIGKGVALAYAKEGAKVVVNYSSNENAAKEVVATITSEEAFAEASRCMSCGLCFDCEQCFMYCNGAGFTHVTESRPGNYFVLALDACEGCGKCIEVCPCGYLEARD